MKVDHHLRSFSAYEAVANVIGVRFAFGAAHQVDFVKIGEAFHHVMRERIDARFDRAIGIDWDVASDHFEPEQLTPLFFEDARRDALGATRVGNRLDLVLVGLEVRQPLGLFAEEVEVLVEPPGILAQVGVVYKGCDPQTGPFLDHRMTGQVVWVD